MLITAVLQKQARATGCIGVVVSKTSQLHNLHIEGGFRPSENA